MSMAIKEELGMITYHLSEYLEDFLAQKSSTFDTAFTELSESSKYLILPSSLRISGSQYH